MAARRKRKRTGLPKKYAKMGFKAGWKAYKRAKGTGRKRKPKRRRKRRSSNPRPKAKTTNTGGRMANPRKRRRRTSKRRRGRSLVPRLSRRSLQATTGQVTKVAVGTAVGVGGAVGTAAVINMLPIVDLRAKALVQFLIGSMMLVMFPRRARNLKIAGAGASLAGALALVKASGLPLPLLAGYDQMGKGGYRRRLSGPQGLYMGRVMEKPYRIAERGPAGQMGANIHYNSMRGDGRSFGPKFVTAKDL